MLLPEALRQFFTYLYILIELLLPIGAAVYLQIMGDVSGFSETFLKMERMFFYYLSLPIYTIYAFQFIREAFPKTYKDVALLFAPVLLSVLSTRFFWPDESYIDIFIYESIPYYLGMHLILGVGVTFLMVLQAKALKWYKILILCMIVFLFAGPAVFVGYLAVPDTFQMEYYASIVISAVFTLPLMQMLYRKEEL